MRSMLRCGLAVAVASVLVGPAAASGTFGGLPVPDGEPISIVQAKGAQIYECRSSDQATLAWQFREPIATLIRGGTTIGRHYAGPTFEFDDGTIVSAKVVTQAPAPNASDIAHLMLAVTEVAGDGPLAFARTVLRINTVGGVATGPCARAGELLSVPYAADYAFFDAPHEGTTEPPNLQ